MVSTRFPELTETEGNTFNRCKVTWYEKLRTVNSIGGTLKAEGSYQITR